MNAPTPDAAPTLRQGLLVEGGLLVAALVLALAFGLTPWLDVTWSAEALAVSVAGTLPMVVLFWGLLRLPYSWLKDLMALVRELLLPMFERSGLWGIALLSMMAGVGEEMLFRGVLQAGLEGWMGELGALVVASVAFGLAHFITPAYFILATVMGAYLGGLYLWTGNLLIPIVVHALYDFLALGYYYITRPDPSVPS